jgi:hypothetical protein
MSSYSRIMAKFLNLPPAETHDIKVEKDIRIPMTDGAVLLANRYYPYRLGKRATTIGLKKLIICVHSFINSICNSITHIYKPFI